MKDKKQGVYSDGVLDGVGKDTLSFIENNFKQLAILGVIPFSVEATLWLLLGENGALDIAAALVNIAMYAIFAIAVHRYILLGVHSIIPPLDSRLLLFGLMVVGENILLGLAMVGLLAPVFLGIISMDGGGRIFVPILFLPFVLSIVFAVLAITARFLTVFPHIAITPPEKQSISAAFKMSKGLLFPIALRLFALSVPIVGASFIFVLIPYLNAVDGAENFGHRLFHFPAALINFSINYAMVLVFVVLASLVYRRLTDDLRSNAHQSD